MNILLIGDKSSRLNSVADLLKKRGQNIVKAPKAWLSAFSSLSVAKAMDRECIAVILVDNLTDAMTAVSARKVSDNKSARIVMMVAPNSDIPLGIPADIRAGVDKWIFPSQRICDAYRKFELKEKIVIQTGALDIDYSKITQTPTEGKPVISWIGDITRPELLKAVLERVESNASRFTLRIAGAGRAATVMPVVKYSRAIQGSDNVVWVGETYDITAEISQASAVIKTNDDITPIEATAAVAGRPVIDPHSTDDYIAAPCLDRDSYMTADSYISHLLDRL